MSKWHETIAAKIGLRLGGLGLLALGWVIGRSLAHLVDQGGLQAITSTEFVEGATLFLSGSAGSALLLFGSGLWKEVRIAERWVTQDSSRSD